MRYILFFFIGFNLIFSQNPVHQISIDGDALLPLFFSSPDGNQKISFRKKTSSDKYLRTGLFFRYEQESEKEISLFTGFDYLLKKNNTNWNYRYGFDFSVGYRENLNSNREYLNLSIYPLIRIEYFFSDFFSISTEPGFYFNYEIVSKQTNLSKVESNLFRSGLKKMGVINFNFIF